MCCPKVLKVCGINRHANHIGVSRADMPRLISSGLVVPQDRATRDGRNLVMTEFR